MRIAITGCIACGKTTFSKILADKIKIPLISADSIVKDLYKDKTLLNKLTKLFNKINLLDTNNNLDKKKLREIIFNNKMAKKQLEGLIHPLVEEKIKQKLEENNDIIAEIPLLFETGLKKYFDIIITIFTTEDIILKRLEERGIKEQEAKKIITSQINIKEKIAQSHYSIKTTGSLKDLEKEANNIIKKLDF